MSAEAETIIVLDVDRAATEALCDQLVADGFAAEAAESVDHFVAAGPTRPDLLVLGDLARRREPIELLQALRAGAPPAASLGRELPVVVLSGRCQHADVLRAFDAGADDVVAKPYSYPELRARVQAVLRRSRRIGGAETLSVGPLVVDLAARTARMHGRPLTLRRLEYELLRALASEPDRVFTREELLRSVWGFRSQAATRTLDSHASRLRRKLAPSSERWVVTVWGVGYRLRAEPLTPGR